MGQRIASRDKRRRSAVSCQAYQAVGHQLALSILHKDDVAPTNLVESHRLDVQDIAVANRRPHAPAARAIAQPNSPAQSLAGQRSKILGVALDGLHSTRFSIYEITERSGTNPRR